MQYNLPFTEGGYARSHFLNMYLGVLHEYIRDNTRCYGIRPNTEHNRATRPCWEGDHV